MQSRNELANAIRALSMDAVERANSGSNFQRHRLREQDSSVDDLWDDFIPNDPRSRGQLCSRLPEAKSGRGEPD